MSRRRCLITLAGLSALQALPSIGRAAAPARLIVASPAGSAGDLIGRDLAQRMAAHLGEAAIVDNRPGGGGAIGVAELRRAAPDGRTLALLGSSTLCILPALRRPPPFNAETDLSAIGRFMTSPFGVLVSAASPWKTLADVVAAARREPGRINVGHTGVGSLGHLLVEEWAHLAGIKVNAVPFDGSSLLQALLRAELPLTVDGLGLSTPHIRAGRLRLLALAGPARVPAWPDTPTLVELGYPGVDRGFWWGLAGPAGMASAVVSKVHAALVQASGEAAFRTRREELGSVFRVGTAEQMRQDLRDETSHWASVAARAKIQLD